MPRYRIVKVRDKYFVEERNLIHYYRLSSEPFLTGFDTCEQAEFALMNRNSTKTTTVVKYIK